MTPAVKKLAFLLVITVTLATTFYYLFRLQAASKARDNQRKSDLQSLQLAIDLYANNQKKFPLTSGEKIFISNQATDFNQKMVGPYLPKPVVDPGNPKDSHWPNYLYWQIDSTHYALFAKLENSFLTEEKLLPPDGKEKGKLYRITIGSNAIEYNWWITNLPASSSPSPTPTKSPAPTPTPTPTPTPAPARPRGTPPGLNKK